MAQKKTERIDRQTWAVWDNHLGVVADVTRMSRNRWVVEDYYGGGYAFFKTESQAAHYAFQLPDPAYVNPFGSY